MKLLIRLVVGSALVIVVLYLFFEPKCCLNGGNSKDKGRRTAVSSDLRLLSDDEEEYWKAHHTYSADLSGLRDGLGPMTSYGVTLKVLAASTDGFIAEATHADWRGGRCVVGAGSFLGDSLQPRLPLCHGKV